jgi:hypothetical protein
MYRMAISLQLACIHHNAAKQQPKTAPDALGMHHRDTEERRFDKFGIGTWARIGSSMSRLLAEGMVGESMVTDAFAPKARVSAEATRLQEPNTPWCLCASVVHHFFRFRCSLERRVKTVLLFKDSSLVLWILPVTLRVLRTGVPHFFADGYGPHNGAARSESYKCQPEPRNQELNNPPGARPF